MSRGHYKEGDVDNPPLGTGTVLAPGYEVLEHLHQSNSYDVYDAWSEERACRCVAKVPRQDLLESEKARRGLLREGRLLAGLTHPHIVRLYETVEEPHPVLIMETLTGETLAHIIDAKYRRLPLKEVVHLGLHLCSAVLYLHHQNIVHLDLKPSNVVSERGLAKVLDLSLARAPGKAEAGAGTTQYMAPEQVRGGTVSPATDVWGIGAVLFEAATAEPPFNAGDEYETGSWETGPDHPEGESGGETERDFDDLEQLLRRSDPVSAHRRVPRAFASLVSGCLEPDPEDRPTVATLVARLGALA